MNHTHRIGILAAGLLTGILPIAVAGQAKPATAKAVTSADGLRGDLIKDVESAQRKFSQLATAMTGKYTWRHADKVRSVSEFFKHVSGENYALPVILGYKAPEGFAAASLQEAFGSAAAMEKITDEAQVKAEIDKSFAHLKSAIASLSDQEMNTQVEVFGQKMTKRGFAILIVTHMHEHLGQMIAYARSNNVAPPWSVATGG